MIASGTCEQALNNIPVAAATPSARARRQNSRSSIALLTLLKLGFVIIRFVLFARAAFYLVFHDALK
ncbi:MAG: hypothetical protein VW405_20780 [Rhodospirillaceae bacterium]